MPTFTLRADTELVASLCKYSSQTMGLKATEYLFRQGETTPGCYLVMSGILRLFMESPAGQKITEREVGAGCIVGLPATINGHSLSLSCNVIEDAELVFLSRQNLAAMMKSDIAAAMKILDLLSTEVQATREQVARLSRPAIRN